MHVSDADFNIEGLKRRVVSVGQNSIVGLFYYHFEQHGVYQCVTMGILTPRFAAWTVVAYPSRRP